jgi:class 3 adenylate cyclase/cephalosporin-C deacetylase-like acetyl esterase
MPQSRRLAAIMFADIMGYTAIMQEDESKAMQLRDKLKIKLDEELLLHDGILIKFSGDGALCSFNSALEAVRAASAIQLFMLQEPSVPLRIGIHQADVVFDETDVYGDGVNIASRLESMAEPGSILVSAKVIDDVKNQKDIQSISLGKYVLKNVNDPMEIFAISNDGLKVPIKKLAGKSEKYIDKTLIKKNRKRISTILFALIIVAIASYAIINPWMKRQTAKNELLPAIQKLVNDNFIPPTQAFDMAMEVEQILPTDSTLLKLWPQVSTKVTMQTIPSGAEVWWKDYDKPNDEWRLAGTTPLNNVRFPRPYLRIEIRKKEYQTIEYAGPSSNGRLWADSPSIKLDKIGSLPEGMVRIPSLTAGMIIVGLEANGGKKVSEFLIDKFEVTNKQFKNFMDAGGYTNNKYWNYPIKKENKIISFEEAKQLFVDKTGRPGPATWEAGTYPDGQENYPVTGVSWYEAAAYAAFANKQLPTVFHWSVVAQTGRTQFISAYSNFNGKNTSAVGSNIGFSSRGIYDLAGNAREWCYNDNAETNGNRYILGGGWNDPIYSFNDTYLAPEIDRSISNGFRCIKELPGDTALAQLMKPVPMDFRDYKKEKPVDDKTFAIYLQQFLYDKKALNEKIETTIESDSWTVEKITFDAGYNNERMQAWLYLPKGFKGPYQPIIHFPGSGDIYLKTFDPKANTRAVNFLTKTGRAVIYPIYKGTFERSDELQSDLPNESVFYKDHVIMWRKDIGRCIDYLETRKDIQADKLGYFGWSWGGYMGGIMPAIETRIKAIALHVGGMVMNKSLPEVDQINFLPRVKQPVIMMNGKYDMFFPLESSQTPMFNFLGTAKENKKFIVYEAGHLVPKTDLVKEIVAWFDKYLGPVR